jgi:hypothetical protein
MHTQEASHTACALLRVVAVRANDFPQRAGPAPNPNAENKEVSGIGSSVRINCVDRAIVRIFYEGCCREPTQRPRRQLSGQWLSGWKLPSKLRTEPLPAELEGKLSVLDARYTRVVVNCDVLLIEAATRRVVDVMQNANAVTARAASRQRCASRLAA